MCVYRSVNIHKGNNNNIPYKGKSNTQQEFHEIQRLAANGVAVSAETRVSVVARCRW